MRVARLIGAVRCISWRIYSTLGHVPNALDHRLNELREVCRQPCERALQCGHVLLHKGSPWGNQQGWPGPILVYIPPVSE
eukprot:scaffold75006_cov36-Tisochrysis_lutea.AAC.10